jgi:hypothetical protein
MASSAALKALLDALIVEQEKRARRRPHSLGDARERLYRMLDETAGWIRADPNYVEPSEEEKAENLRELDEWFAEHYGSAR